MKFCVIGLGRFGYQLAISLAENGMEVLGVDKDEAIIASIRDLITQAVCMKVEDEASLRSIGVDEMDTVIVAMGEDFSESILITALLKKRLHIPYVITRGVNDIHKEILTLVGSDRIVLPEKEIGIKIADKLSAPFVDMIRVTEDFSLSQIATPKIFIGKSLKQLSFYDTYQVRCVGIKDGNSIVTVGVDYVIKEDDVLVLAGTNDKLDVIAGL